MKTLAVEQVVQRAEENNLTFLVMSYMSLCKKQEKDQFGVQTLSRKYWV